MRDSTLTEADILFIYESSAIDFWSMTLLEINQIFLWCDLKAFYYQKETEDQFRERIVECEAI